MIRLKTAALGSLRNRLRDRGARASIALPSSDDGLLGTVIAAEYGAVAEAMYLVMAADGTFAGAERDVIRGALRELDDRIRSRHVEAMLANAAKLVEVEGRARRIASIAEACGDDREHAEGVLLLACAVAYADNEIAPQENEILAELMQAMRIDSGRAHALMASLEKVDLLLARDATADAADLTISAAMRLRTPEDFERLAATSDRPDVTLLLRLYASFARSGEETRDKAAIGPQSHASARVAALRELATAIPEARSPHIDAVRNALGTLAVALEAVDAAESLRAVTVAPIINAVARLSQLVIAALRRCGENVPDAMMAMGELSAAVETALRDPNGVEALGRAVETAIARMQRTVPADVGEVVELVLRKLPSLPLEPPPPSIKAPALPEWLPSRRTLGGFHVHGPLGAGGTATVFVVSRTDEMDEPDARKFALKVPQFDAVAARSISEAEFLKMFREEAGALLSLPEHPNIASFITFDAGARPKPILVMELVEGTDCDKLIASRRLSAAQAFAVLDGVLAGLEAMHGVGIGHLDIKPSNVILRPDGRAVLVDFGLAGRHIRPGCATASYAAPEVWGYAEPGVEATPRTADVYSFGCLAWEMLAGRPLFDAPNDLALLAQHMEHDGGPPEMVKLGDDSRWAPLVGVMRACLRRSSAARPTVSDLRAEMRRLAPYYERAPWPI